jgi:HTH-type transcriptional regulator / antitoxin HigA
MFVRDCRRAFFFKKPPSGPPAKNSKYFYGNPRCFQGVYLNQRIFVYFEKSQSEESVLEIKPIHTEEEYEAAMARIEEMFGVPLDAPESDELEILLALTGAYEKKHHYIEPPDVLSLLEYRMDQMGLSQEQIDRFMQTRKRIPEILSRESGLSIEIIKSLEDIPFEAFTADQP